MRYIIKEKSQSGHCCFEFSVVDTFNPVIIHKKQYIGSDGNPEFELVCECFFEEDATLICDALNKAAL